MADRLSDVDFAGPLTERQPPFDQAAEVAVLGAMMIDKHAVVTAFELLDEGAFYWERNRRVFRAMQRLWERGDELDVLTLADVLKKSGELEAAGGWEYVSYLMDTVPTAANLEFHARIVREKATLRALIQAATETIRDVYEQGSRTAQELLAEAEARVMAVDRGAGADSVVRVKERLWPVFEEIERRGEQGDQITGIPTGLCDLDRQILGLHAGQLVVVAARPSMGKTSLAMGFALQATITGQVPAAFFSFEMSADELTTRGLAMEARLDLQNLWRGKLSQEEHQRMATAAGHLNTAPLYIDDSSDVGLQAVTAKLRRLRSSKGIRLALVDYLQLMEGTGDNRREDIEKITRALKRAARALHIPIVLLSQLSRGPEQRTNKRPMMSDLRESGGIEQDADVVILLYRPEYYMEEEELAGKGGKLRGLTELIVAKQRNGPTGTVRVHFHKESTRFENLARERPGM